MLCSPRPALTADVRRSPETEIANKFVMTFPVNDFRLVDWNDVCADPAKFIGRPIELRRMRCVYGMDGFRCGAFPRKVTASAKTLTVFARSVIPGAERAVLKNNCATLQAMLESVAYRRKIRIIPAQFSEWSGGEVAKSVELKADKIQILPGSRPKRYAGRFSARRWWKPKSRR
ncbi:hypothetical protein J2R76_004060 [Bradyrhizobium sp. USDA 4532]|uniref:hypothetical protein n=1 Tax=unclassified Bradyrhizobium TaxID=2631580 RepID=UPI00209DC13D|nr:MULTISPECIES: hypothetical protein [unclassified Bradyrhizobium]MCP1835720.1 hypothetical protein [Bradyrhizobium sp. USDA 4545]MCP1920469.1 hypothetical protein [Bradyrhizobium sp. USDA 4532]